MSLRNEWTKILAFVFKNVIITRSNVFSLFEILFWPTVGLLSVGLLATYLQLGPDMMAFILIGVISMSVVHVCQIDIAYVLLYDVWGKCIKHEFIAPVNSVHLILGSWLIGIFRSGLIFILLALFSSHAFHFDFLKPGIEALGLFLVGLFLTSALVGIAVCILVLIFGHKAEVAAWSLVSLMLLICGIYYPISMLPAPIMAVAKLIPLTYFLEYFRSFYGFHSDLSGFLAKGYGYGLLYLGLAWIALNLVIRNAKRTGILIKLSE
ncbi:MAG: ABC transporter permease [Thermodesulfobacteriota bacterium]